MYNFFEGPENKDLLNASQNHKNYFQRNRSWLIPTWIAFVFISAPALFNLISPSEPPLLPTSLTLLVAASSWLFAGYKVRFVETFSANLIKGVIAASSICLAVYYLFQAIKFFLLK
ncbi:hypothetical protein HA052_04090 [Chromobacterium haemolyticum]|uniref:Uncharacterized protein n=1 Tax=Chromobacterium fluminis TaxID=3044269 RepID=A0ABX0L0P8_9NEIS|nr:hypothetical protein [Chromobacterium haemolyticum]NHR04370.1 hypothetical protein [Chromobacterium haemolyticum]